MSKGGHQVV